MKAYRIPYKKTNLSSRLIIDYINQEEKLQPFINHFPDLDVFQKQIEQQSKNNINRELLSSVLEKQNSVISVSEQSEINIQLIKENNTFTITTGHQLSLFTGPLYFFYKIISAINLAEKLKEKYPVNNFVPIFWMATEDHDFQEINHINLFGKKIEWNSRQEGPVGRMNLNNIKEVIDELKNIMGESKHAEQLVDIFHNAYLKHKNLSDATRYLINYLFGDYGIVVIDGDDKELKREFIPYIKKDILENAFFKKIEQSSINLTKMMYTPQAFFREINFFKLLDDHRVLITEAISEEEIDAYPERFSPNVLLRPLYQESILPNLAYVGGSAEIGYWLQLKSIFDYSNIPFPILILRNSILIISDKQKKKLDSFNFNLLDLFKDEHVLQKQYIMSKSISDISILNEKQAMIRIYSSLLDKAIDQGVKNHIKSELNKQLKILDRLGLKFIRLAKQKDKSAINQISKLKKQLFPNNNLQERYDTFIPFYLEHGENFIKILKQSLNPLDSNFVVLTN